MFLNILSTCIAKAPCSVQVIQMTTARQDVSIVQANLEAMFGCSRGGLKGLERDSEAGAKRSWHLDAYISVERRGGEAVARLEAPRRHSKRMSRHC